MSIIEPLPICFVADDVSLVVGVAVLLDLDVSKELSFRVDEFEPSLLQATTIAELTKASIKSRFIEFVSQCGSKKYAIAAAAMAVIL
jgi:hypothetical protein